MRNDQTLHEIGDAREIIDTWLDEHEGELIPSLEELLTDNTESFNAKAERVALYIDELETNAESCKASADRLAARAKSRTMRAEGLRTYLCTELARREVKKIDGTLKTVSRVKNSQPKVNVTVPLKLLWENDVACNEGDTSAARLVHAIQPEIEYKLNRDEVLRRFKAGEELPAAIVVEQGESVRIR